MTDRHYILTGKQPEPVEDLIAWAIWMEEFDRAVMKHEQDGILVSTVFLGILHGFENGVPILFETMIFGGAYDEGMWRYTSWDDAEKNHMEIVESLFVDLK